MTHDLDWRICDHCGHRFPFKGESSILDPGDGSPLEQWCGVCLREWVMSIGNWWDLL